MAIREPDENTAIVEKVKSILDNAKYSTHKTIVIEAHEGEIPTIRYNITELIFPFENDPSIAKKEGE